MHAVAAMSSAGDQVLLLDGGKRGNWERRSPRLSRRWQRAGILEIVSEKHAAIEYGDVGGQRFHVGNNVRGG